MKGGIDAPQQISQSHRSRAGCLTCRRRKKKCDDDSSNSSCRTCVRLGLECERGTPLVWEDDLRRNGMGRRGPSRKRKVTDSAVISDFNINETSLTRLEQYDEEVHRLPYPTTNETCLVGFIHHPVNQLGHLKGVEVVLLENYVQRFSRTYPTFSGPSNPFLSILLPFAIQNELVIDSLLVLSSAQMDRTKLGITQREYFNLRQRAFRATRKLLADGSNGTASDVSSQTTISALMSFDCLGETSILALLANAVMFLLHDKVSGETTWRPHLEFISQLCEHYLQRFYSSSSALTDLFHFLYNLFLYNDLVRATTLHTSTFSDFYPLSASTTNDPTSRFYFPGLIARISAKDDSVTEADILAWDGNMGWLPSLSLNPLELPDCTKTENAALKQLHETAAMISLGQLRRDSMPSSFTERQNLPLLAAEAVHLACLIPQGSALESALLWPLGIAARELTREQEFERALVLDRLQCLETTLGMRHFQRVREVLANEWSDAYDPRQLAEDRAERMILLG